MKKIATILFACIIGLSMTMAPTMMAQHAYADETTAAEQDGAMAAEELTEGEGEAEVQPETDADASETEAEAEESGEMTAAEETSDVELTEETVLEGLEGMYISDIENDPEMSYILEDPTFYRYYEVDEDGLISKKEVDLDEVERFLAEADANADGIDDVDNVETDGDITAMGGGVTGLGKGQTPAKYSTYTRYHCIDISWWQGKISDANWKKIKAAGVTHAIIRCGYSTLSGGAHNMDSTFASNLNGAYNAGIKVGVYYYSTATSASEAKSEAQYVSTIIKSYKSKITLPVAYDYETGGRLTASVMKKVGTASCTSFCDTIKAAGYTPMVYANYNTLCNYIDYKTLQSKYKIWLANYTTNGVATSYPGQYWMWQYSSSGKVNGLSGYVDINYIFVPKSTSSSSAAKTTTVAKTTTTSTAKTTTTTTAKTTAAAAAKFTAYAAKTTTAVNYRTGPGTKYKVKGTFKKGTKIKIVGLSGKWGKLSSGYYVYLKYTKKTSGSTSAKKYPYTAKTTTSVNYRTGAGTGYKIKGTYKKGTKVTIKSEKNGWGRMSNGYYIKLKFVK